MPGVFLNEDDYNFDIALRRFKKQVEKAGILSEMKKRQHFEKPSVMRKKKKAAARKRLLKKMRKMNAASSSRMRKRKDKGFGTLHRFDGSASRPFWRGSSRRRAERFRVCPACLSGNRDGRSRRR